MENKDPHSYDPLVRLLELFEGESVRQASEENLEGMPPDEVLVKHIVDGTKKNLETHIDACLETRSPLSVINDVLLEGMKTVGELFGAGKMQLPFVLQSAEVMKQAVKYLEPMLDRSEAQDRGSILLATVAGDVHDIGKNLVDIILSNNGYRVVNIGIKQPINNIIEQALEHKVDVIGMSGLLVKSTLIMKDNLSELNDRGLSTFPVILGGAALTRGYVEQDLSQIYKGQVRYAQDAFEGLRLMEEVRDTPNERTTKTSVERVASHRVGVIDQDLYVFSGEHSEIEPVMPPKLPFYGARSFSRIDLGEVFGYVNRVALFRGQWQYKKPQDMTNAEFSNWLEQNVEPVFERLKRELFPVIKPEVKWGYFYAKSSGNDLIVYEEDQETERTRFTFPRQRAEKRLCLADFFQPEESPVCDVVGFSLVTIGRRVTELERKQFQDGSYQEYLWTHGLGVETAEALAEYWHLQMRRELSIDDNEPAERRLLFSAKYHGARYSFGYPACPNLEDQSKIFDLLRPEDIGVSLTEEFMLDPEQSTSAIVIHHPDAKYFNIR